MYILGISCYYHDSAAVILKDGIVIAAADEERFSRKKHDASYPKRAIDFCLKQAKISSKELDYVVFYEKPFLKFERIFLSAFAYVPSNSRFFQASMREWFFDKLWIKSHIIKQLSIDPKKLLFSEHHLSHAASSFYPSPFKKAAVLSIDGVGEWTTASWGVGEDTKVTLKEEIRYPNSLGLLYSAFTVLAGFEANEGEYKLMGLAPYGKPKYVEKIYKLLDIEDDGSFKLKMEYFSYPYNLTGIYTKKFEDLFGKKNKNPDKVIKYYADIASSIQFVLEEQTVKIASYVRKATNMDYLCYAGGVALNSKANWEILKRSGFKEIFIQPSAGDSGGALGAALWVYHAVLGKKRKYIMNHAYLGASETENEIKKTLENENIKYEELKNSNKLVDQISEMMRKGKVIGWVQDEFEWGPRALGHRSILADPRSIKMKEVVNSKIKFREAFRPFAPSTTYEDGARYFDIKDKKNQSPFKFMLYVVPVNTSHQNNLGAITHVDGTARPQFVNREINPLYHKLIKSFGKKTGLNVILNTSFNLKGEPIVNTTREALSTFNRSGIDILVVNKFVIKK